jgi:hypothetical protein
MEDHVGSQALCGFQPAFHNIRCHDAGRTHGFGQMNVEQSGDSAPHDED